MARFNEILAGRYNRALQKLLSMKGGPPSPQLASEVVPSFPFFWGAEMRYLEGWNRFAWFSTLAASVGNIGHIRVRNPANSTVVAVFEKLLIIAGGADATKVDHGATAVDLLTIAPSTNKRLDPRGNPQSALILSNNQQADTPIGDFLLQTAVAALTGVDLIFTDIQEIPLLPGDALQVRSNTANQSITATWWWRERTMEESERF